MSSPCLTCELKNKSKESCTKAGSYCIKLLNYQVKLDKQASCVRSSESYDIVNTYSLRHNGQTGRKQSFV